MRVLHLYSGNLYGGVERTLMTLAEERLCSPAMEPHFGLCFQGRLSEELTGTDSPVHMLGAARFSRPWTVSQSRHRLARLLEATSFNAVVCHSWWPHAIFGAVVRRSGVRLVHWAHDLPTGTHWLERLASRTTPDLLIANSGFTRAATNELFSGAESHVIYPPVPPPTPQLSATTRADVRLGMRTAAGAVVILMASRFERCKGHSVLMEALANLRSLPNWECWVAGGVQRPHEHAVLRDLQLMATRAEITHRLRFLGHRSDVRLLMDAADIYCQPNVAPESFGLTFVEALYARLPVVTTAIGGAAEIIKPPGPGGLLLQPGDPRALAAALRELIVDPQLRANRAAGGPEYAQSLCGPAASIVKLSELLQRLTASAPTRSAATRKKPMFRAKGSALR